MKKFLLYELATFTTWGISLTDVNNFLQFCLLVIGVASACMAFWQTIKGKKKQPPVL